jgi:hypothetical protein
MTIGNLITTEDAANTHNNKYSGIKKHVNGLPFSISDAIFNRILYKEIDSYANRDYTVVQLDHFPHSSLAGMSRSQLCRGSRK